MEKSLLELVFILDKSGSMHGLEKDTIGGFNSLIEKQKKENTNAIVTTVLFNGETDVLYSRKKLKDVEELTDEDYVVCGNTALLDAVGSTIYNIMRKQELDEIKPTKTMVFITTDGYENASCCYSYNDVKGTIKTAEKENNLEVVFLGANLDVAAEAQKLGIRSDNAVRYNCDSKGVKMCFEALSDKCSYSMMTGKTDNSWRKKLDEDYNTRSKNN